jgi:hypothetical protein
VFLTILEPSGRRLSLVLPPLPRFDCHVLPATRAGVVEASELSDTLLEILRAHVSSAPPLDDDARMPIAIAVVGGDSATADVCAAWLWVCTHHAGLVAAVDVSFHLLSLVPPSGDVPAVAASLSSVSLLSMHDPPQEFEQGPADASSDEEESLGPTPTSPGMMSPPPSKGEPGGTPGRPEVEIRARAKSSRPRTRRHTLSDSDADLLRTQSVRFVSGSPHVMGGPLSGTSEWAATSACDEDVPELPDGWVGRAVEFVAPPPASAAGMDAMSGQHMFEWLCRHDGVLQRETASLFALLQAARTMPGVLTSRGTCVRPAGTSASSGTGAGDDQAMNYMQFMARHVLFRLCGHARQPVTLLLYTVDIRFARGSAGDDGEAPPLTLVLLRRLHFARPATGGAALRLDLSVADLRGQVTPFRGQSTMYDAITVLRLPLSNMPAAYPSPNRCELELTYRRKGTTTALLVQSCVVATIDEAGFSVNVDGRQLDRVSTARISPAVALQGTPAGFRDLHVALPVYTFNSLDW